MNGSFYKDNDVGELILTWTDNLWNLGLVVSSMAESHELNDDMLVDVGASLGNIIRDYAGAVNEIVEQAYREIKDAFVVDPSQGIIARRSAEAKKENTILHAVEEPETKGEAPLRKRMDHIENMLSELRGVIEERLAKTGERPEGEKAAIY